MTAVEWLIEQLEERGHIIPDHIEVTSLEMEKQQIIDAVNQIQFDDIDGMGICDTNTKGEQYYNETYGSKGSDETKTDKI
jgi:hypothetical protein